MHILLIRAASDFILGMIAIAMNACFLKTDARSLTAAACLLLALVFVGPALAQERVTTLAPNPEAAAGGKRVALVIGNANYRSSPLRNPVNDARAMARALADLGFRVEVVENASQSGMRRAVRKFGDDIATGGVGLFYYAGHGMQVKGRNYLIPVNAEIEREDEIEDQAVDAGLILSKMESARNPLNLMILDACRNNPFARNFRSASTGLAQMDAPSGTLVAFATAPGSVASDGAGENGLYTQHLLRAIREPGLAVEQVFKRVRIDVTRDTNDKQVPWESSSLRGDFYFRAGMPAPPVVAVSGQVPDATAVELAFWDTIKSSASDAEYQAYLKRYPDGVFADLARSRLRRNSESAVAPSLTPAPKGPPPVPSMTNGPQVAALSPGLAVLGASAMKLPSRGDQWQYAYSDNFKKAPYTVVATVVGDSRVGDAVLVNGESKSSATFSNSPEFVGRNIGAVEAIEFAPYLPVLGEVEVIAGKSWIQDLPWSRTEIRMVSVEPGTVRVPAGEYIARKVTLELGADAPSQIGGVHRHQMRCFAWYSEVVKRFVKLDCRGTSWSTRWSYMIELTAFKLN